MKKILQIIFIFCVCVSNAQNSSKKTVKVDTIHEKKIIRVIDTVYIKTTFAIKVDTVKKVIVQSEYNKLYEETLNQKQLHYDSALNTLNLIATVFGLIITLLTIGFGMYGFRSIKEIRQEIKADFNSEKQENLNRIKSETRRITGSIYDKQINEVNEKLLNLERFAEDSTKFFSVKRGKEAPHLKQEKKSTNPDENPFNL